MSMFNDYQYEASKTFKPTKQLMPEQVRLLDWATGLGGESGEVLDIVKHGIFHGEEFNKMELAKELGDVLWYVSAIATTCDIDLGDVAALNRAKLNHRYISGKYSESESANRHKQENAFEDTAIYKCLKARICNTEEIPFSIIVVGPDGSGKTTFTKVLAKKLNMQRIKCDYRQEDKLTQAKMYLFMEANTIYDRFYYPDELIYSEVKNIPLDEEYKHDMHDLIALLIAANVIVIYLDADLSALKERSAVWADDYVQVDQLEHIKKTYSRYLGEIAAAGVPIIELDTSNIPLGSAEWEAFLDKTVEDIKSRAKFFAHAEISGREKANEKSN